jgi:hypothetical protein
VTVTEWDKDPEVAVTVTVNRPVTVELTVRIEVCDPPEITLSIDGFKLAALFVVARVTRPLKLFRLDRLMVLFADDPASTVRDNGLADMVKSGKLPTVKDTVVE